YRMRMSPMVTRLTEIRLIVMYRIWTARLPMAITRITWTHHIPTSATSIHHMRMQHTKTAHILTRLTWKPRITTSPREMYHMRMQPTCPRHIRTRLTVTRCPYTTLFRSYRMRMSPMVTRLTEIRLIVMYRIWTARLPMAITRITWTHHMPTSATSIHHMRMQ